MSDVGGGRAAAGAKPTIDDEAPASLHDDGPLAAGTYKPVQATIVFSDHPVPDPFPQPAPTGPCGTYLSVFDGTDPTASGSFMSCTSPTLTQARSEEDGHQGSIPSKPLHSGPEWSQAPTLLLFGLHDTTLSFRETAGREEGGLCRCGGDPQAGAEPGARGLQGPRGPRADGLRPLPRHVRPYPGPDPRGLRLREARGRGRHGPCPSPPPRGTRFGAPTSGTWTWSTSASCAPRRTP